MQQHRRLFDLAAPGLNSGMGNRVMICIREGTNSLNDIIESSLPRLSVVCHLGLSTEDVKVVMAPSAGTGRIGAKAVIFLACTPDLCILQ